MGKTQRAIQHVRMRADQRLGTRMTKQDIRNIGQQIRSGNAVFHRRKSNIITVWYMEYKGQDIKVLYDKSINMPVTVCLLS